MLAAWQGREQEASELIQVTLQEATPRGTGVLAGSAAYATAVLHNGLGEYEAARDAARPASSQADPGQLRVRLTDTSVTLPR
jgi:hypothetical protein